IYAISHADPWMAVLCFISGIFAWIGSGISLGAFMDSDKRNYLGIFMSQVAASFTAVSMPSGVGPAFVNLQFLRKSGYRNTIATAIMSAVVAVQFLTTFILLIVIGIFTGRNSFSSMIPTNTLAIVLGVVAIAASVPLALAPLRKLLIDKLLPIIASYARQLLDMLTQPKQLAISALGALLQSLAFGLSFWAALKAFGYPTNVLETTFIFLLANTLGSAVPTPGGLGAVEAALTFGFSSLGVPTAVALSATLLFRVATYWLRIPLGALAMKWLNAHNLV
ncbi:MAG: lysylphosphatidylglycerol synthase transmembrane domain-containing protein, partial [Bifidobacterium psychraerophilum]|uniref:lysylphosphatidylglycerol synthase transmembrane domain-containing protein n=1 Tax=Bifidobacterium psychraerophilum TaxID=218140 RepID=UPI0039EBB2E4